MAYCNTQFAIKPTIGGVLCNNIRNFALNFPHYIYSKLCRIIEAIKQNKNTTKQ